MQHIIRLVVLVLVMHLQVVEEIIHFSVMKLVMMSLLVIIIVYLVLVLVKKLLRVDIIHF